MPALPTQIAVGFELALLLSGAWLLWRLVLSPSARAERKPPVLAPWEIFVTDFFLFIWLVIIGGLAVQLGTSQLLKHASLDADQRLIFVGSAFHFGMLGGMVAFRLFVRRPKISEPLVTLHPVLSGIATFLVSLPILALVSFAWQGILQLCGIPAEKQDLIDLFANAKSPGLLAFMIALATLVAPVTEELLFRAGLFRYARTRLPRWAALLLPACLFGALHVNLASFAPLVALGIIFSLAYERTGRIATTIVAHGLFNLNLRFGHPAQRFRLEDCVVFLEWAGTAIGIIVNEVQKLLTTFGNNAYILSSAICHKRIIFKQLGKTNNTIHWGTYLVRDICQKS